MTFPSNLATNITFLDDISDALKTRLSVYGDPDLTVDAELSLSPDQSSLLVCIEAHSPRADLDMRTTMTVPFAGGDHVAHIDQKGTIQEAFARLRGGFAAALLRLDVIGSDDIDPHDLSGGKPAPDAAATAAIAAWVKDQSPEPAASAGAAGDDAVPTPTPTIFDHYNHVTETYVPAHAPAHICHCRDCLIERDEIITEPTFVAFGLEVPAELDALKIGGCMVYLASKLAQLTHAEPDMFRNALLGAAATIQRSGTYAVAEDGQPISAWEAYLMDAANFEGAAAATMEAITFMPIPAHLLNIVDPTPTDTPPKTARLH